MALDVLTRIGQFVLYLGLGYFFLVVVLALSGEMVQAWPLRRRGEPESKAEPPAGQPNVRAAEVQGDHGSEQMHARGKASPAIRRVSSERHLEFLDRLRTNLKYQGSTVALIVFAVILLGLQHVLDGPEIGTLLGGITGYVLGTSRGGSDAQSPPPVSTQNQGPHAGDESNPLSRSEQTSPSPKA